MTFLKGTTQWNTQNTMNDKLQEKQWIDMSHFTANSVHVKTILFSYKYIKSKQTNCIVINYIISIEFTKYKQRDNLVD